MYLITYISYTPYSSPYVKSKLYTDLDKAKFQFRKTVDTMKFEFKKKYKTYGEDYLLQEREDFFSCVDNDRHTETIKLEYIKVE